MKFCFLVSQKIKGYLSREEIEEQAELYKIPDIEP